MAKRRKLDPNRFKKDDEKGLFSFDPIRRRVLLWGVIAGASGGFFMLRPEVVSQLLGVFIVVLVSNYHINKAARRIPRWHATILSFAGVIVSMFSVILVGNLLIATLQAG
jgi:hypothetical protein